MNNGKWLSYELQGMKIFENTHKKIKVSYDEPCTAHITILEPKTREQLEEIRKKIMAQFPERTFSHIHFLGSEDHEAVDGELIAAIEDIDGEEAFPFIEIDWSHEEYVWEDHIQEIQKRILAVLENI